MQTLDTIFHIIFGTLLLFSLGTIVIVPFAFPDDMSIRIIGTIWYTSAVYVLIRQLYWKYIKK